MRFWPALRAAQQAAPGDGTELCVRHPPAVLATCPPPAPPPPPALACRAMWCGLATRTHHSLPRQWEWWVRSKSVVYVCMCVCVCVCVCACADQPRCVLSFICSPGTIEEKVYQRQLSKEGLQQVRAAAAAGVGGCGGGGQSRGRRCPSQLVSTCQTFAMQVVDSKAGGKSAGPNLMSVDELRGRQGLVVSGGIRVSHSVLPCHNVSLLAHVLVQLCQLPPPPPRPPPRSQPPSSPPRRPVHFRARHAFFHVRLHVRRPPGRGLQEGRRRRRQGRAGRQGGTRREGRKGRRRRRAQEAAAGVEQQQQQQQRGVRDGCRV